MNINDKIEQIDPDYLNMPDDQVMGMSAPAAAAPAEAVTPAASPEAAAGGEGQEAAAGSGEAAPPPQAAAAEATGEAANTGKAEAGGQNDGGAAAEGTGEAGAGDGGASGKTGDEGKAAGEQTTDPNKTANAGTKTEGQPAASQAAAAAGTGGAGEGAAAANAAAQPAVKALKDYSAEEKAGAFDKLMAPFKANDRTIELRSPEEAIKLMQMGANYTKKLQTLQPHLRATRMLENNGLLDENKLSFLIDVAKGNPLAIQKLLADTQFDPMGVDKDKAADYTPGNHQVTDSEMAFQAALDEVEASDSGKEFIQEVAQWDKESKQALFQHPEVLSELNQQRDLGLYEQITSELQRLKMLGQIPQTTPFLQAYRAVGDMLHAQGRLKQPSTGEAPAAVIEQPVEVRVATPPAKVTNSEQAAKAAPTKSTSASVATTSSDVLGMADDKFLEQMQGRV